MKSPLYNRRQLLKNAGATAAGLAVPVIVPANALGLGAVPAPSERIAFGMLGTGGQACNVNLEPPAP